MKKDISLWVMGAVCVVLRLLPHPPNVAPAVGIGLFCGAVLARRHSLWVPVAVMALGDAALGFQWVHLFGWAAILASALIGWGLKDRRRPARVAVASVAGSTVFFLLSNFGVWLLGCVPGWYPATFPGLLACYAAGLPFYRNSLGGDLLYAGILFGTYELFLRRAGRRSLAAGGA